MKKGILFFGAILFANVCFSQWSPTGTLLTDNKFRSGAIGIGYTTSPAFGTNKLMVSGNSNFSNSISIGNPTYNSSIYGIGTNKGIQILTGTNNAYFELAGSGSTNFMAIAHCNGCFSNVSSNGDAVLQGLSTSNLLIANEKNGNIKFATGMQNTNVKVQMVIDNVGNIGIGTGSSALNPSEKLAVNGLIHTKEVKVDLLNWPDYVFEEGYNLPTLEEVESQIQTNGHLANIPSAKEVEENGVLLGDMNKKLLEKVEELTLYIIQMNKEIELLKAQIKK